jgi:CheY-like chemotaxis protein
MRSILVADDCAEVRQLVKTLLEEEQPSYQVLEAGNGLQALQRIRQEHPALVILDRQMPGLTGDQVSLELRADPATREIPVVLMTGDSVGDVQGYMFSGVNAVFHKPFCPNELVATVRQLLQN